MAKNWKNNVRLDEQSEWQGSGTKVTNWHTLDARDAPVSDKHRSRAV